MKKNTILITGGLGFIGTNLIRHFLETTDKNILVLDKATYAGRPENLPHDAKSIKRVTVIRGDITKRRIVNTAVKQADIVIHLAADTHTFRSLTHAVPTVFTNVVGTTMLLEAAERYPVERFILISSSEVYGNQIAGIPMDENHPLNPVTPYAASKLAADRLANSFYLTKNIPVTILRFFNAYGPYQHPEKMVPLFITRLIKDQSITLNHGGVQMRDWVFVQDHARAIAAVLAAKPELINGEAFNIGTGTATSIKDVAMIIVKALDKDESSITYATSGKPETMGNVGISKKAKKILHWVPSHTLTERILETVQWYKDHRAWWDR